MSNKIKSKRKQEREEREALVDVYALISGLSKEEAAAAIAVAEGRQE